LAQVICYIFTAVSLFEKAHTHIAKKHKYILNLNPSPSRSLF